jgi:hypothetical protein
MNYVRFGLSSPWQPESYKESTIGNGLPPLFYGNCEAKFPKM